MSLALVVLLPPLFRDPGHTIPSSEALRSFDGLVAAASTLPRAVNDKDPWPKLRIILKPRELGATGLCEAQTLDVGTSGPGSVLIRTTHYEVSDPTLKEEPVQAPFCKEAGRDTQVLEFEAGYPRDTFTDIHAARDALRRKTSTISFDCPPRAAACLDNIAQRLKRSGVVRLKMLHARRTIGESDYLEQLSQNDGWTVNFWKHGLQVKKVTLTYLAPPPV